MSTASPIVPRKVRSKDGFVHFSDLKKIGLSPLHYLASCESEHQSTRAMRVGTVVHFLVLGPRLGHKILRWPGERKGNAYLDFANKNKDAEIITAAEWADAEPVAAAVLADPVAREVMKGARYEVPLRWEENGLDCCTDGVDILGPGVLADLKTTTSTQPDAFQRHAFTMRYAEQLAFYAGGARLSGFELDRLSLIGVEVEPPYAVTVLDMSTALHDYARRNVSLWMERLRVCEESDAWPGYLQCAATWDLPPWLAERSDEDNA